MLLRANPYRCGLLLLLVWQIVPILLLTRHSIGLYAHYHNHSHARSLYLYWSVRGKK